jgi:hypothetical protein
VPRMIEVCSVSGRGLRARGGYVTGVCAGGASDRLVTVGAW